MENNRAIELVTWTCPACGEANEDIPDQDTHCAHCGEVVFVLADGAVDDQHWKVNKGSYRF